MKFSYKGEFFIHQIPISVKIFAIAIEDAVSAVNSAVSNLCSGIESYMSNLDSVFFYQSSLNWKVQFQVD